jgi:plastocyanin
MPLLKFSVAVILAAAVSGAAWAQSGQSTVITVQLSEYKFAPVEIDLDHGQSYVLRVVNSGGKAHDLSAKAFFQSVSLAPASASQVQNGQVELAMGESADVAFTAGAPGTYEMHCTHPLHAMLGMRGRIVVR